MKYSNRFLGFLLLFFIISIGYILYSYFFKINLTNLEINANVNSYSGSLFNVKFKKDFYCEKKKCIIDQIPAFSYNLTIKKDKYKKIFKEIDLGKTNKIDVFLEKNILMKEIDKTISRENLVQTLRKKKQQYLKYQRKNIKYNTIINNKNYVYFTTEKYINFINLFNNNHFKLEFELKTNYIKDIGNNIFVINTENGSFSFNIKTKELNYFSLFEDYVSFQNYYIGIINEDDKQRKINFGLEQEGNLVVLYDLKTKKIKILDSYESKITKIYKENQKIFINLKSGEKFEIVNL